MMPIAVSASPIHTAVHAIHGFIELLLELCRSPPPAILPPGPEGGATCSYGHPGKESNAGFDYG
jgi:hypothetical protein